MISSRIAPGPVARLLLGASWLVVIPGCGSSDGPTRYVVSGQVTHAGQPVQRGFITFVPDDSAGNSGPGGGAEIVKGKYTTARGRGVVGGPHKVRIIGYDGVAAEVEGEQLMDGKPLFPPYEVSLDLPHAAVVQNFEVPAGAEPQDGT